MTEREWLKAADPRPMLKFLRGRATSERKVRLFACACCRRIWHDISPSGRHVVETAERFADGAVAADTLSRILWESVRDQDATVPETAACWTANPDRHVVENTVFEAAKASAFRVARSPSSKRWKGARDAELQSQAELLRDVVGNPFCPVEFSPAWRTDTAVALARTIYDSREFSAMPILADALEDAGCDNDDILSHCRGEGPHVRGCWVVDLVLGKE